MVNGNPDISVIMSVYNGEAFLAPAVDSVLAQTFQNWELILMDDCSTDSTPDILAAYAKKDTRIRVYRNETNQRLPASLNRGIGLARGRYVARMDADDICLPDRLEKQLSFMDAHPELDLSCCRFMTLCEGTVKMGVCGRKGDPEAMKAMLLFFNPVLHPGVIAKTECMKAFPYDPAHTCSEDLELWIRMSLNGLRIAAQPEYLMLYRIHGSQITATTKPKQRQEALQAERRYFESLLFPLSEAEAEFYIDGVYFSNQPDMARFLALRKKIRRAARERGTVSLAAVDYAAFEVLSEYRRKGITKGEVLRGLCSFSPAFLVREYFDRKKRVKADIERCTAAAKAFGLKESTSEENQTELPVFEWIK